MERFLRTVSELNAFDAGALLFGWAESCLVISLRRNVNSTLRNAQMSEGPAVRLERRHLALRSRSTEYWFSSLSGFGSVLPRLGRFLSVFSESVVALQQCAEEAVHSRVVSDLFLDELAQVFLLVPVLRVPSVAEQLAENILRARLILDILDEADVDQFLELGVLDHVVVVLVGNLEEQVQFFFEGANLERR